MGLNAPALIFTVLDPIRLGPEFDWFPGSALGFYTDDLLFLMGVIVVGILPGELWTGDAPRKQQAEEE
jgi:hypothetical protein